MRRIENRFRRLPAFLLITYFAISSEKLGQFNETEVTFAAMIVTGLVMMVDAAWTYS